MSIWADIWEDIWADIWGEPVTATIPVLTTPTSEMIEDTRAVLGTMLSDDGGGTITERGIVWALTATPTIADNKVAEGGTAEGTYTDTITGLPVHTTIYFRGYATNEAGTGYSDVSFFATSESLAEGYPGYIVTNKIDGLNCNSNLLTNPSFETGDPPDDWTGTGTGSSVSRDGSEYVAGSYSAKLINGAGNAAFYTQVASSPASYDGEDVSFGCWVKTDTASRVRLFIRDTSGAVNEYAYSSLHTGSGSWEFLSVTKTCRTSLTDLRTTVFITSGSAVTAYFDSAKFVVGDSFGILSSSENGYYPLTNLFNKDLANPFKWESGSSGYIEIDFGINRSFNFVALLNHSFTSTVTVTVAAGSTPDPSTIVMTFTHRDNDMFKYTLYKRSSRYVRLSWTDSGGAAVHEIGELIIGELIILTSQFSTGFTEKLEEGKIRRLTHKGVQDTFNLYSLESREYYFGPLSETQLDELKTLHTATDGNQYPFVWIPDIGNTEILYCKKTNELRRQNISPLKYESRLSLREESRGVEVTA